MKVFDLDGKKVYFYAEDVVEVCKEIDPGRLTIEEVRLICRERYNIDILSVWSKSVLSGILSSSQWSDKGEG